MTERNPTRPALLLLEPRHRGHHAVYADGIARGAVERGWRVLLATSRAGLARPSLRTLDEDLAPHLGLLELADLDVAHGAPGGLVALVRRELAWRSLFGAFVRGLPDEARPDLVFLPYLDYAANAFALLGSPFGGTPWCGLVMRPLFHLRAMGVRAPWSPLHVVKRLLFSRLLRRPALVALFTIDATLERFVRARAPAASARLTLLRDPAPSAALVSRPAARERLGLPAEAAVVLLFGEIGLRKGLDALLRASTEPAFPARAHLLLAGQHDATAAAPLGGRPAAELRATGRLHVRDAFLSEAEADTAFAAADVAWLGYRGHHVTSSVLVRAGRAGLPVVACREGLIGRLTEEGRLGVTVAVDDPREVARALAGLVGDPATAASLGQNGRRFFADHTPEAFAAALFAAVGKEGPGWPRRST